MSARRLMRRSSRSMGGKELSVAWRIRSRQIHADVPRTLRMTAPATTRKRPARPRFAPNAAAAPAFGADIRPDRSVEPAQRCPGSIAMSQTTHPRGRPGEAGALSFWGGGRIMRFGAARVAWKSCRAAAGAAINVACAALLAITPPHPDLLLTTGPNCLPLRRPRRAYDAVAGVNVVDVRTAERMMKLAAALCTRGLRAEAKDVLRRAIALASPHAATPRSALILLLEEDL